MQQKQIWPNILRRMPYALYMCVSWTSGASIIGGGAPSWITKIHYYRKLQAAGCRLQAAGCRLQAAGPQWVPKELKMALSLFKNGSHLYPNAHKSVGGWGSAPDPSIITRGAPLALASLTRRIENVVNAIEKWVPFGPKCSWKSWRLGLRPADPR